MCGIEAPLWWDRDADRTGRIIRPDVRAAALAVWATGCRRARAELRDPSQAAELMESTVAQVSRYLDRQQIPNFSRELKGLVTHSFQRSVQRCMTRRRRFVTLNAPEQLSASANEKWEQHIHSRLQLNKIVSLLSKRSGTILALRYAGYTWKEIAQILDQPAGTLRSVFWRDVSRARVSCQNGSCNSRKPQLPNVLARSQAI